MQCSHCSSTSFRLSSLHREDIPNLLLLKYPVRCRDCHQRSYSGLWFALGLRRAAGLQQKKSPSTSQL
jgi:hypothetical protein